MSLGIFKKAFNSTQVSDLTAYFSTLFPQKTYKEYSVLVTQNSGTSISVDVLVDDFNGGITVSRSSDGIYFFTSAIGSIFDVNKTSYFVTNNGTYSLNSPYFKTYFKISRESGVNIKLETFILSSNNPNPNGGYSDTLMFKVPLTIKVYN